MITRSEVKLYSEEEPKFDDILCGLKATAKIPRGVINETKKVIAIARKFNNEVVRPHTLELDKKIQEHPDYLPWDFVKKASDFGIFTMWLPKILGGKGFCMTSFCHFIEEISSECLGMANMIAVHYLGFGVASSAANPRIINMLCKDVLKGIKNGNPVIVSLALTEPNAGTDMEEMDLMDKGNICCHAEKVPGGYVVNGTKVFISGGHLATWHTLIAATDLKRPSETTVMMMAKTGSKGFSFGRVEKKMGQKGAPASELIFKDCFIPDDCVCIDHRDAASLSRDYRRTMMQITDYYFAASRAGVGALGAGAARSAYEKTYKFACETKIDGILLINHEWVQCMLADMYKNICAARLIYMEANNVNIIDGMYKPMQGSVRYYLSKVGSRRLLGNQMDRIYNNPATLERMRKMFFDDQEDDQIARTSGWASLSKFAGTDLGVKNTQMALEIMGQAGIRHDRGAEKLFRDAKLLQIYEGTNQLNRLNLFKCLIARDNPQVTVFNTER